MKAALMARGARTLARVCAQVKPGDKVLVVTEPEMVSIAEAVAAAAYADEGVHGTVHIGIGTSASLGGTAQAKTHFDALMWLPTLTIDERVILRDGMLSI